MQESSVTYLDLLPYGMPQREKKNGIIVITQYYKRGQLTKLVIDDTDVTSKIPLVLRNTLRFMTRIRKFSKTITGRIKLLFTIENGEIKKLDYELKQSINLRNNLWNILSIATN